MGGAASRRLITRRGSARRAWESAARCNARRATQGEKRWGAYRRRVGSAAVPVSRVLRVLRGVRRQPSRLGDRGRAFARAAQRPMEGAGAARRRSRLGAPPRPRCAFVHRCAAEVDHFGVRLQHVIHALRASRSLILQRHIECRRSVLPELVERRHRPYTFLMVLRSHLQSHVGLHFSQHISTHTHTHW